VKKTYCPYCTAAVRFPPERENTKGKCPGCSKVFTLISLQEKEPSTKVIDAPVQTLIIPVENQNQASNELQSLKHCSFCGEQIAKAAIKCKHCNEFLDGRPKSVVQQAPTIVVVEEPRRESLRKSRKDFNQQQPTQSQTTIVNVNQQPHQRWSRLVAGLFSLIFPGLGHCYKGKIITGMFWAIIVIVGYAAFVVPGIILHLICVLASMAGNTYR
jgi:TM2 domain-containing membrane protein YozV